MIRVLIDHLLQFEERTVQTRENLYDDVRHNRISVSEGFHSMLRDSRDTSCLRVGFLVGYATSVGLESETLMKMATTYGGPQNPATYRGGMTGNHMDSHDQEEPGGSNGTSDSDETDGNEERDDHADANNSEAVVTVRDTNTSTVSNANGYGEIEGHVQADDTSGTDMDGHVDVTEM
jgi:hypothetical protein